VFRRAGSIGLLEPGLVYLIMNIGLARTSATHASLITALQPVLIVLIGWLVLRQPFPKHLLIPMCAVLIGTALVITEHMTSEGAGLSGDVLVLTGTVIAAVYVLANSRIAHDLAPLALTLVQQFFAVGLVVPLVAIQILATGAGHGPSNPWSWVWVPVIGITTSSLTFWLYLSSLRHLSAGAAGQFLAVIPIVGFAGSVVVLGEPAGLQALIGSIIVALALVSVARQEHRSLDAVEHDAEVAGAP
jgi:drug/metabolite transporter (DMT)-like permease